MKAQQHQSAPDKLLDKQLMPGKTNILKKFSYKINYLIKIHAKTNAKVKSTARKD